MGKTCDKTRDHMHTGSESFRNDIETSKEVEQESCNKLTQPLLKMFSGESVYPYDTGRNVAERKLGVNNWNHTRISNKK